MTTIVALFTIAFTIALAGSLFFLYQQMIDNLDLKCEVKNLTNQIERNESETQDIIDDARHLALKVLALEDAHGGSVDPIAHEYAADLDALLLNDDDLNYPNYPTPF